MSATSCGDEPSRFRLEPADFEGDSDTNPIIRRFTAKKRLVLEPPVEKNKVNQLMASSAAALAKGKSSRVVVFKQRPDDARKIYELLTKRLPANCAEVLTGTMRGLERDELLKKPVLMRLLDGEEKLDDRAGKEPAVLVSTSAGEIGLDLNADHLICDAAPLDSMIQRLGRVNRRGHGDAKISVYTAKADVQPAKSKSNKSAGKSQWDSASVAAMTCLELLTPNPA